MIAEQTASWVCYGELSLSKRVTCHVSERTKLEDVDVGCAAERAAVIRPHVGAKSVPQVLDVAAVMHGGMTDCPRHSSSVCSVQFCIVQLAAPWLDSAKEKTGMRDKDIGGSEPQLFPSACTVSQRSVSNAILHAANFGNV